MVNSSNNIVYNTLQNKNNLQNISELEIEEIIIKYPAFHSAYLVKAFILNKKNEDKFQQQLPIIATNVKDRAILHDFIYEKQILENELIDEVIEQEVIQESTVLEVTKEIEPETAKLKKLEETIQENKVEEEINIDKFSEEIAEEEIIEEEITESASNLVHPTNIDLEKEYRRNEAMRKLQEELFEDKMRTSGSEKDAKRIEAMKKLQDELFETKATKENTNTDNAEAKEEIRTPDVEETDKEIIQQAVIKEFIPEEKDEIISDDKIDNDVIPVKQEIEKIIKQQELIVEQINIKEKEETDAIPAKLEIEKLLKQQEEIVEKIISEENQFEEKEEKLEFIDWLKLKNSSNKGIEVKIEFEDIEEPIIETEENSERIPIDPSGMIEAEMHQEIKASTDPLENFISTQITRKKRKKKINNMEVSSSSETKKSMIVSETLAEILVVQQKYNEAIDVYSLLGLKYPQKSIYFARQIEKIKNYL